MHFPKDEDSWEQGRRRLAFDELFLLQMAALLRRKNWQEDAQGVAVKPDNRGRQQLPQGPPPFR